MDYTLNPENGHLEALDPPYKGVIEEWGPTCFYWEAFYYHHTIGGSYYLGSLAKSRDQAENNIALSIKNHKYHDQVFTITAD